MEWMVSKMRAFCLSSSTCVEPSEEPGFCKQGEGKGEGVCLEVRVPVSITTQGSTVGYVIRNATLPLGLPDTAG